LGFFGYFKEFPVRYIAVGKNAAGHRVFEHFFYCFYFAVAFKPPQIGRFAAAKELNPLMGEILEKAHNGAHWPVQVGNVNRPAKTLPAAYTAQIQRIVLSKVKVY
jgi:hypothetical protein